jgi:hypothetical protein
LEAGFHRKNYNYEGHEVSPKNSFAVASFVLLCALRGRDHKSGARILPIMSGLHF